MMNASLKEIVIPAYQAKDIMSTEVLSVYEGWSVQRLADFFINHNISGAPVIAADHELIGVVSVSDIFHFENSDDDSKSQILRDCYREYTGIDIVNQDDLKEWSKTAHKSCTVHQIMAKRVISVEDDCSITDIAALMSEQDIHRVFVTHEGRIAGVISTTDVLRTLISAQGQA